MLVALLGVSLMSCGDDKDEFVTADALPQKAKEFLIQFYPGTEAQSVTKDHDDYTVILKDGSQVEFDKKGEWQSVEAALQATVPAGFYPAAIDTYIAAKVPQAGGICEISKEYKDFKGYEVQLLSGVELAFDWEGNYLGVEN